MMNNDATSHETAEQDRGILLAQLDNQYWLIDGDRHLDAMLSAEAPYPTPVHCLRFSSLAELATSTDDGLDTSTLWSVHPEVVKRLERDDELVVVAFSECA